MAGVPYLNEQMNLFEMEIRKGVDNRYAPPPPQMPTYQPNLFLPPQLMGRASYAPMPPTMQPDFVGFQQKHQQMFPIAKNLPVAPELPNFTRAPDVKPSPALPNSKKNKNKNAPLDGADKKEQKRKHLRMAAGTVYEDPTLQDWDPNDFRIFCGDLGNDVTENDLVKAFKAYPSFQKAKVIRDKRTNKTKGFGFVSFKDSGDFIRAMKEVNGKYVGNRPIKLRKSVWQDRQVDNFKKKDKQKKMMGFR